MRSAHSRASAYVSIHSEATERCQEHVLDTRVAKHDGVAGLDTKNYEGVEHNEDNPQGVMVSIEVQTWATKEINLIDLLA